MEISAAALPRHACLDFLGAATANRNLLSFHPRCQGKHLMTTQLMISPTTIAVTFANVNLSKHVNLLCEMQNFKIFQFSVHSNSKHACLNGVLSSYFGHPVKNIGMSLLLDATRQKICIFVFFLFEINHWHKAANSTSQNPRLLLLIDCNGGWQRLQNISTIV